MDVKQAVASAKGYLSTVFDEEDVTDLRLEEVVYDDTKNIWLITLGFLRPTPMPAGVRLPKGLRGLDLPKIARDYKVVSIDDNGRAISITNREGLPAL